MILVTLISWLILIMPSNPLTSMFRSAISQVDERIIMGHYPDDEDVTLLKEGHVTTIVSLLDPAIPYEAVLLKEEQKRARIEGITLLSFPMSSILGYKFGNDYDLNASRAAQAILTSIGKVYLHCYLGRHRVEVVRQRLEALGVSATRYAIHSSERAQSALLLDQADRAYKERNYETTLLRIAEIPPGERNDDAFLLRAWAHYQLHHYVIADELFQDFLNEHPRHIDAQVGLGYTRLREGDPKSAKSLFREVVVQSPALGDALAGLGLALYHNKKPHDARIYLAKALDQEPDNQELSGLLRSLGGIKKH